MTENRNLWSLNKHQQLILKLALAILLVGFAFKLLVYRSADLTNGLLTSFEGKEQMSVQKPKPPVYVPDNDDQMALDVVLEKCDLITGDWVPNPSGPIYTNESCLKMDSHQNCMKNGRPDTGYLYWRWKPRDCQLPQFDPRAFLEMMRNKRWGLIGDSISRNHVESLLCLLSTVERAVEVYHDEEYKSKRWHFPSYNLTVSNIWAPFLVQAAIFEDLNGVSSSEVQLQLDKLDKKFTDEFETLDYMIISTGKWFLKPAIYHENDTVSGCHYCPGKNITQVGFVYAYNKTLNHLMDFIANSNHKGLIFFRTSTPDHFENGEWHSGGTCKKTNPVKDGEIEMKDIHKLLRDIELAEFAAGSEKAAKNGVNLQLLDFANLLLMRPDGHPGPYREFQPFANNKTAKVQNDCLHWCLPGPIDAWNDLIMEMVVNS